MSNEVDRRPLKLWERLPAREGTGESNPDAKLEVHVIFTDTNGTLAALNTAGNLASNLGARVNLVAAHAVPYVLPLDRPLVSVAFTEQKLLEVESRGAPGPVDTKIRLILCRDKRQALLQALKPQSLVVIGGRGRWWFTWERRGASPLQSEGHEVISALLK